MFIVAGEASGDAHAARLIRAVKATVPNLHVEGLGGENMKQAGVYARSAVAIDDRNPRAWFELAVWCGAERKVSCALSAWQKAARDLPIDAVMVRLRAYRRMDSRRQKR